MRVLLSTNSNKDNPYAYLWIDTSNYMIYLKNWHIDNVKSSLRKYRLDEIYYILTYAYMHTKSNVLKDYIYNKIYKLSLELDWETIDKINMLLNFNKADVIRWTILDRLETLLDEVEITKLGNNDNYLTYLELGYVMSYYDKVKELYWRKLFVNIVWKKRKEYRQKVIKLKKLLWKYEIHYVSKGILDVEDVLEKAA